MLSMRASPAALSERASPRARGGPASAAAARLGRSAAKLEAELEDLTSLLGEAEAAEEAPEVAPTAIVVGIDPALFPSAPRRRTRKEQKQKLLEHDSATAVVE